MNQQTKFIKRVAAKTEPVLEFMRDVSYGLSRKNKKIESKYFYDDQGSQLFNTITRHPDYYLTRCELEILSTYKKDIARIFLDQQINIVELGPGEGIKTTILLDEFMQHPLAFTYYPVDISKKYLQDLKLNLVVKWPKLEVRPIHGDYLEGIQWLIRQDNHKNLVIFLGSSIGNFTVAAANQFLKQIGMLLNHGDYVLIGFDLRKDINTLLSAYNDSDGVTRQFNFNLLHRMNYELNADFKLGEFEHTGVYNSVRGAMESYLLSRKKQTVYIEGLHQRIGFDLQEPIHLEYSHKYILPQIVALAKKNNFNIVKHFMDSKHQFVNALWQINKAGRN